MTNLAHLVLTDRDVQILMMIYAYGGCTADHVQRRFFRTKGGRIACYARIAKLVEAEYVTSVRLPSQHGIGSGKAFLTPGPKARPILAEILGLSRTQLARARADSVLFIQHHLALVDLRLAIELACEHSTVFTLKEFQGDHELRRTPIKVTDPQTKQVLSFVPDASFTLAVPDGSEQIFLVEMDLGNLAPKRCREKLRSYLIRAKEAITPVLFVTSDQSRADSLAKIAQDEAEQLKADPTIFWLTPRQRVNERSVLDGAIWAVAGGPEPIALGDMVKASVQSNVLIKQDVASGGLSK